MNKRKSKSLAAIFMAMVMVFSAVVTMSAANAELQELQLSYTDYEDAHYYDCCSSTVQPHQMVTCWLFGCWDSGVRLSSWTEPGGRNSEVCSTIRHYARNKCGWSWACTGVGYVEGYTHTTNGPAHRFRTEWIGMGSFQICTGCGYVRW